MTFKALLRARPELVDVREVLFVGEGRIWYVGQLGAAHAEDSSFFTQPFLNMAREWSCESGLLYRRNLLWVPKGLVQRIMESEHDTKVTGHMGQDKTIELIRRNFWWPKMNERIIDFVRSCPKCQRTKMARHQPYGLSSPLELPYAPWQSIAMDFITELPISDGCDQLWVIIDRFTKMVHFLPLRIEGKTVSDLAVIFAREVWKYHGLPTDIVSDRDSRFTSETWKEFLRLSGIRSRMSTGFHPQTDGQTERLNQTIEAYLRAFVSKEQDDWARLLPMAEFAYNNSTTTGNGMSPFYVNYGFHPAAMDPASTEPLNPASQVYTHWMSTVHDESRKGLEDAQERMRQYADPVRREPPAYQVGDLVMLNGRNIKTRRPSKKLDHKNHFPFQIKKIFPHSQSASRCPGNGKYTTSFMCRYMSHTELANTGPHRTRRRYSGRRTTLSSQKNTMWKKLCPRLNAAEGITSEFFTSSNGSTIRNAKTGWKNHSTTFQ